jgi:hypothetical protein
MELTGPAYLESTSLRFNINNESYTDASLKLEFVAINKTNNPFKSELSGLIGIGPYTMAGSQEERRKSFMLQLKQQGLIDHAIVSIFVRGSNDSLSHIKFGSWDINNTDGFPAVLKTKSRDSWEVIARGIKLPGENLVLTEKRMIDLDPAYPDIYVPDADWDVFTQYLAFTVFEDDGRILEINKE